MSSYFDAWDKEQHRITSMLTDVVRREAHRDHELKLAHDVTLCVEWTGCPEDIRDSAYTIMNKWGVNSLPHSFGFAADNPDVDTEEDEWRSVGRMSCNLHTLFHELGSRGISPFTDNPLAPLRDLFGQGEERRLVLAKIAAGYVDVPEPEEGA